MFEKLRKHESYGMFNEPLNAEHCLFEHLKHRFTTLYLVELSFRTGAKYQNSNQLINDIRLLIIDKFNLVLHAKEYQV